MCYFLQLANMIPQFIVHEESVFTNVCIVLNATFFSLNHWIFTWHFFEAAQMFKLTFSEQTYKTLN